MLDQIPQISLHVTRMKDHLKRFICYLETEVPFDNKQTKKQNKQTKQTNNRRKYANIESRKCCEIVGKQQRTFHSHASLNFIQNKNQKNVKDKHFHKANRFMLLIA